MVNLLQGIPVTLYERQKTGTDAWNAPVYTEVPVTVNNVLVTPADPDDVVSDLQLYGKRAEYTLCLPKDDAHVWENRTVEFFGRRWRVFGFPAEYIGQNLPLGWNRKVRVERYG